MYQSEAIREAYNYEFIKNSNDNTEQKYERDL